MVNKAALSRRFLRHVHHEILDESAAGSAAATCGAAGAVAIYKLVDPRDLRETAWTASAAAARLEERIQIVECLTNRLPLLNVESDRFIRQLPLI